MALAAATAKGTATRELIVDRASQLARVHGLEGLSIGAVATAVSMSKSGVFAHFGSREDLQLAVLDEAARSFGDSVLMPAIREPRGLPRLEALIGFWADWVHRLGEGGCLLMGAVGEYDDRAGPIHDRVVAHMRGWRHHVARAVQLAIDTGELRADIDAMQVAFEIHAVALGLHHDARLFGGDTPYRHARRAIERLIDSYRA